MIKSTYRTIMIKSLDSDSKGVDWLNLAECVGEGVLACLSMCLRGCEEEGRGELGRVLQSFCMDVIQSVYFYKGGHSFSLQNIHFLYGVYEGYLFFLQMLSSNPPCKQAAIGLSAVANYHQQITESITWQNV